MNTSLFPLLSWILVSVAVLQAAAATETITYAYDAAGRLTQATYSGGATIAYVYDTNGNLLQRTTTEGGATTYTLIYRAGTGGTIDGVATQQVVEGQSGTAVSAVEDAASVVFRRWSDGRMDKIRTDTNVQANNTVQASFLSQGGADLDWYAAHGIVPGSGEDWTDVDARVVAAKGTTLRHENIADTDPGNVNDTFRILAISNTPPITVTFTPGSTARVYRLMTRMDLTDGSWTNVPGQGPRPGIGGEDAMTNTNATPHQFYRIEVRHP